jgi:hypothetical protein
MSDDQPLRSMLREADHFLWEKSREMGKKYKKTYRISLWRKIKAFELE